MTWWRDTFHPGTVPLRKMVSCRVLRHVCSYISSGIFFFRNILELKPPPRQSGKKRKKKRWQPLIFLLLQTYRSTIEKLTYWVQENRGGRWFSTGLKNSPTSDRGHLKSMIPAREETWDLGGWRVPCADSNVISDYYGVYNKMFVLWICFFLGLERPFAK